jgi:predicted  nucleic acid-binding Zn ribbon protein
MLFNPYQSALRKYVYNILQDKYGPHHLVVERIGHSLATDQDALDFLKMLAAIYETAYMKGIADFQTGLKKQGYDFDFTFQNSE